MTSKAWQEANRFAGVQSVTCPRCGGLAFKGFLEGARWIVEQAQGRTSCQIGIAGNTDSNFLGMEKPCSYLEKLIEEQK